jgi:DMSO/TMAO reductase YedYZ molybdopterin-dependent catalytic subunit
VASPTPSSGPGIVPLLAGALLLLVTGLMNIGYWYGWGFDFIRTHYWTAWIVTGALVVHVSAKLPVLRRALARSHAAPDMAAVRVQSLQRGGYSSALLNAAHARDPDTLLALELNGAPLQHDHGYPVRLIAPTNPGVMQTKWLESVTVL